MELSHNEIFLHPVDQSYDKNLDHSFHSINSEETELDSKFNSKFGFRNAEEEFMLTATTKSRFRKQSIKISNLLGTSYTDRIIMYRYKYDLIFRLVIKTNLNRSLH
jgi:hypothetical protein